MTLFGSLLERRLKRNHVSAHLGYSRSRYELRIRTEGMEGVEVVEGP